jgi:ABC-2 type transport system permease protein
MNDMIQLIRRELWEHRALYIVPLVFIGIILLSVIVGLIRGTAWVGEDHISRQVSQLSPEMAGQAMGIMSFGLWGLFAMVSAFVVFFYAIDALYGDRKDRSVLFWKSLPITDTQTVLSKVLVALVVVPGIVIASVLVTAFALLILLSIAIAFTGNNPFPVLWTDLPLVTFIGSMLSIEIAHALWFLPVVAWLLFASSASKRSPFLIALLVPLGIAFAEKLAFNTDYFASTISNYIERFYTLVFGGIEELSVRGDDFEPLEITGEMVPARAALDALTDPALFAGLAVGAVLIVLTIRMRHQRIDIG